MTECVHIRAPQEFFDGPGPVTVHDLQMAHIFRPPRALREHGMREDDEVCISIQLHTPGRGSSES